MYLRCRTKLCNDKHALRNYLGVLEGQQFRFRSTRLDVGVGSPRYLGILGIKRCCVSLQPSRHTLQLNCIRIRW